MEFQTRDRYRHVVEKIAKSSGSSESEVAAKAIQLARRNAAHKDGNGCDDRSAHVGFFLIDKGLAQLEQLAGGGLSGSETIRTWGSRCPLLLYIGTIMLMTMLLARGLVTKAYADGLNGRALWLTGVLSILCVGHLAVALVNRLATLLAAPHPLPRMDLSKGIPTELRSLVVVPAMLLNTQNIEDLIEALEVRFLANRDDSLHFGLLTDFRDAEAETLPEDEPLLLLARQRIEELNEKYQSLKDNTFFLFHR